jgi:hypothetical protein
MYVCMYVDQLLKTTREGKLIESGYNYLGVAKTSTNRLYIQNQDRNEREIYKRFSAKKWSQVRK